MGIFSFILQVIMNYCEAFVMIGSVLLNLNIINKNKSNNINIKLFNIKNFCMWNIIASVSYICQKIVLTPYNCFISMLLCIVIYFMIIKLFYRKVSNIKIILSIILMFIFIMITEIVYIPIVGIFNIKVSQVQASTILSFIISILIRIIELIIEIITYIKFIKGGIINEKIN